MKRKASEIWTCCDGRISLVSQVYTGIKFDLQLRVSGVHFGYVKRKVYKTNDYRGQGLRC